MTMSSIIENPKHKRHYSGKVSVSNGYIYWKQEHEKTVNILIDEIKIIGEYTTSIDSLNDDWFMVFLNKKGEWQKISMYAEGINIVRRKLVEKLHSSIHGELYTSTSWNSSIVYPQYLKGEKLFDFEREDSGKISTKLKRLLGFNTQTKIRVNEVVKNYCAEM
jgi:hypothetical protein